MIYISFRDQLDRAHKLMLTEKRELMVGNLKNQISKWWLLLINTNCDVCTVIVGCGSFLNVTLIL